MAQIITPPFTAETARKKVQLAEDGWNSRNPEKVSLAYSENSQWRNRNTFLQGRPAIKKFLTGKWSRELHYKLEKELWAFQGNRISVRFEYEWMHAETGQWFRSYGNEQWEFNDDGLMARRYASVNDLAIDPKDLRITTSPDSE
ncbi:MAG: DUF4440 domain-containing protein [Alphaproteobacteria bacterium]|nr:MAG: DUF4440 domain-containing protein [Alphaproteobacteria bacterium]